MRPSRIMMRRAVPDDIGARRYTWGARHFCALVTEARVILGLIKEQHIHFSRRIRRRRRRKLTTLFFDGPLVGDDVINCPHVAAPTNPLTAKARVILAMTDYSFFGA